MQNKILPIDSVSLKTACVKRLEEMILTGALKIDERLPSERDFAKQLGVSRPVLHQALVELAAKGLVRIEPRRGVFINDYRRYGSLAMLETLLSFQNGNLEAEMGESMLAMRLLLERETARLAALHRSEKQVKELERLLEDERKILSEDVQGMTDLDFEIHLCIAIASGNHVYPLMINSFKSVYTALTAQFFRRYAGTEVVKTVYAFHDALISAIKEQNAAQSEKVMAEMLAHGAKYLYEE